VSALKFVSHLLFVPGLKYYDLPVDRIPYSPLRPIRYPMLLGCDCRFCGAPLVVPAPLRWRLRVWFSIGFRRPFAYACGARGAALYSIRRRAWFCGFKGCGWD
jgi:hypothetical protein